MVLLNHITKSKYLSNKRVQLPKNWILWKGNLPNRPETQRNSSKPGIENVIGAKAGISIEIFIVTETGTGISDRKLNRKRNRHFEM